MTPNPRARRATLAGEGLSAAVRPAVTILFAVAICYGFLVGRISSDQFLPAAMMAIVFYFGKRESDKADASVAAALMRRPLPGERDVLVGEPIAVHRPKPVVENN